MDEWTYVKNEGSLVTIEDHQKGSKQKGVRYDYQDDHKKDQDKPLETIFI